MSCFHFIIETTYLYKRLVMDVALFSFLFYLMFLQIYRGTAFISQDTKRHTITEDIENEI